MPANTLMIQGTASNAGKSLVTAALCRLLSRRGFSVAPFKPQNMALNSAVTIDGGEIGRAQAFQAEAAGILPHTDMNPVLLKPCSSVGSQVIVHGKVLGNMNAREYHRFKPGILPKVLQSYNRLAEQYDWIIVEGAGSPAEINLREGDIANMGFAERIGCPVIIVADIDRGGVFAQIFGTLAVLSQSDQRFVSGFVINKFRGDLHLLTPGIAWLEQKTGRNVFGVIPYIKDLIVDAEDSLSRNSSNLHPVDQGVTLAVAVPLNPHLSNDSDFTVLNADPQVSLKYVHAGEQIGPCDLIILPGSKNVQGDLANIISQGWDVDIRRHLRYGGRVLGICGGFQMLGRYIHDPYQIESDNASVAGLKLLNMETTLKETKRLSNVSGSLFTAPTDYVEGFEIHMGVSSGPALERPAVIFAHGSDGAVSQDGQIIGTYVHGLFDHPAARQALMRWAGLRSPKPIDYKAAKAKQFELLADTLEQSIDIQAVLGLPGQVQMSNSIYTGGSKYGGSLKS